MIKPIGPQYIAAKKNQRVGLTHASRVIDRLMRIYGLDKELQEHQEIEAAEMQSEEFAESSALAAPALPMIPGTQSTFSWFQ